MTATYGRAGKVGEQIANGQRHTSPFVHRGRPSAEDNRLELARGPIPCVPPSVTCAASQRETVGQLIERCLVVGASDLGVATCHSLIKLHVAPFGRLSVRCQSRPALRTR